MGIEEKRNINRALYVRRFKDCFSRYDLGDLQQAINCSRDCIKLLSGINDRKEREAFAGIVGIKLSIAKWIILSELDRRTAANA